MKFWEAVKNLQEGKRVRCCYWDAHHFWDMLIFQDRCQMGFSSANIEEEWELYEEPALTFTQVIEGLKDGKRFRRRGWKNARNIRVCPYMKENGMNALIDHDDTMIGAILHLQDFEATDWEEVK